MTREEAIHILENLKPINTQSSFDAYIVGKALTMAVNSLKVDEMYDLAMETYERLITRDDVLYAINACGCLYHIGKTWYDEEELIQCFDDLYFSDSKAENAGEFVQKRTGHWIEKEDFNGDTYYDCSECGESFCLIDGTPADNLYNYCPNCGARMFEPQESEET